VAACTSPPAALTSALACSADGTESSSGSNLPSSASISCRGFSCATHRRLPSRRHERGPGGAAAPEGERRRSHRALTDSRGSSPSRTSRSQRDSFPAAMMPARAWPGPRAGGRAISPLALPTLNLFPKHLRPTSIAWRSLYGPPRTVGRGTVYMALH